MCPITRGQTAKGIPHVPALSALFMCSDWSYFAPRECRSILLHSILHPQFRVAGRSARLSGHIVLCAKSASTPNAGVRSRVGRLAAGVVGGLGHQGVGVTLPARLGTAAITPSDTS